MKCKKCTRCKFCKRWTDGWEIQKKAINIFNTTKSSTLFLPLELLNVLLSSVSFSVMFCFDQYRSVLIITVNRTLISRDRLWLSVSVSSRYGHLVWLVDAIQVLVRQGSKKFQSACPTQTTPSECRGGRATFSMIIHGLQNLHPLQILQSRSDERDSMSGGSLAVNPAHKSLAFGEAWRRLAKIVSEGDSI